MYTNLKKIALQDINVTVHIDSEGTETHMAREIELVGQLSEDQKKKLMEIADKCPIHRLLSRHIVIEALAR